MPFKGSILTLSLALAASSVTYASVFPKTSEIDSGTRIFETNHAEDVTPRQGHLHHCQLRLGR